MTDQEVPVLVVGGSLVGLSTSLLLAHHGVKHLLVERHRGTAIHPRAASFHQRTMEVFRSVGLQPAIEAAAEREFVQNGAIVAVDSLAGKELAFFYRNYNEGVEDLSPTSRLFITQVGLEPLLRDRARELGAEHRYATELVALEQDEAGVTSVIRPRDGGRETTVRSQYVVAADGAHSFVRGKLGIPMLGRGAFADCVTIYFKADVRDLIGDRNLSVVYVNHPELLGFFRFSISGDAGFLAVFATIAADGSRDSNVGEQLSEEQCVALVRKALGGRPDLPVEIDNVQRWAAGAGWAASFRDGRVFLAGDAAHAMPPTGGFGGNTGVGDAHNLAWKLALTLDGTAGPGLLDSYDAERRPICASVVEQAYARYALRVDPTLPRDDLATPLDDPSIELGYVHKSAAVLPDPAGSTDAAELEDPRTPTGRPGVRAPHVVVEHDSRPISVHDLFGRRFVLLTGADGAAWLRAAEEVSDVGTPVDAYADARFSEPFGIGLDGAALVRPDGVVAWRAAGSADDAPDVLRDVLGRVTA